mgnify:CR=1 FL=1
MKLKEYEHLLDTDCWFNYADFYEWISQQDYKTFIEVGVWKGHSIMYLAQLLKLKEDPSIEIYAVDLFDETYKYDGVNHGTTELRDQKKYLFEIYKHNMKRAGVEDIVKPLKGMSWEMADKFEDDSIDFVFLDAGHDYDECTKDLKAYWPKVKEGGILSGHDWKNLGCGVRKAVQDFFGSVPISTSEGDVCWYVKK